MKIDNFLKFWASFLLVLFCIRYIPLETRASISMVKVVVSVICALLFISYIKPSLTKAVSICLVYFIYLYISASMHPESFRSSTLWYRASFFITFCTFYELVHVKEIFSLEYFLKLIKGIIFAYFIVLIIHQLLRLAGINELLIVNLWYLERGIGSNSLSGEPSTFARIMGVLYYAYLKCSEYQQGYPVNIQQIFNKDHRYVTLAFGWSMLTMGSGTAFICLGVLSLYFMRGAYFVFTIPIIFAVYSILSYYEVKQFERATMVTEATLSGDADEVREVDGSASTRIAPVLNTINNLDIGEMETWFGHGIDYSLNVAKKKNMRMMGEIDDYGLISYILSLFLVFSCCIDFFSLGTIMFFLGIGGGTSNIAYGWGLLMIMTCIKYFHQKKKEDDLE